MRAEVLTTIRTVALAAGIPAERVEAGITAMDEGSSVEPLLLLCELARHPEIRMHQTHLHRLGIRTVAETFGGRPRYRLGAVLAYLRSPACAARREQLRATRKARDARKAGRS